MGEHGLARKKEISAGISQDTKQGNMVERKVNGTLTDKLSQSIETVQTQKKARTNEN